MSLNSPRLKLPTVTLCAAASVNVAATLSALVRCLGQVEFGRCLLFTDADVGAVHPAIEVVAIERLASSAQYSDFILTKLHAYVTTEHLLIAQWDGFILEPGAWDPTFLEYDYVGAIWPQFDDGRNVGNGGFSLRSLRLLKACLDPQFDANHPEDVAICRVNRDLLDSRYGIRVAPAELAQRFSFERSAVRRDCFGFHGVFNMPHAVGLDDFWNIYLRLDDRRSIRPDFASLLCTVWKGEGGSERGLKLLIDALKDRLGARMR